MMVSQQEIRSRIEQLQLSFDGYRRQLSRPGIGPERRERLEIDVAMLQNELSTLEKLAQLGRVEPDRARIEQIVEERLAELQRRSPDIALQDQASISGEARALLWATGQDRLTLVMQEMTRQDRTPDPSRADRSVHNLLLHTLSDGPDPESRGSAAYELGKLHVVEAIPALASALHDISLVAQLAAAALQEFNSDELSAAGVGPDLVEQVRQAAGDGEQRMRLDGK